MMLKNYCDQTKLAMHFNFVLLFKLGCAYILKGGARGARTPQTI